MDGNAEPLQADLHRGIFFPKLEGMLIELLRSAQQAEDWEKQTLARNGG